MLDTWLNISLLAVGPTESGKEFILAMIYKALSALLDCGKETPGVKAIDRGFASGQAVWWAVHDAGPVLLFDTELGDLIDAAGKGRPLSQEIMTALVKLHDSVAYEGVVPMKYSSRMKKAAKMLPIDHPFLSVHGTTTPAFYGKVRAMAGEDGSLNRFLILNCAGKKPMRPGENVHAFPEEITDTFKEFKHPRKELRYEDGVQAYQLERREAHIDEIRRASGTWGRFGIKSSRLALAAAVASGRDIVTEGDMTWACDVVELANRIATWKFEECGGLAHSEADALMRGILAMFKHKEVRKNKGFLTLRILNRYCWPFMKAAFTQREQAVKALEKSQLLVPVADKGWRPGGN